MRLSKEEMEKLPLAEQRVLIAKDVLELLDANKIQTKSGKYLWTDAEFYLRTDDNDEPDHEGLVIERFRKEWAKEEPHCGVCQIGGLFVAALDIFNSLKLITVGFNDPDDAHMTKYLKKWWSEHDLRVMECAFEGNWNGSHSDQFIDEIDGELLPEVSAAFDFYESCTSWPPLTDEERMRSILGNIISNNGEFVPSQLPKGATR
jgi:hypothetical protein